MTAPAIQEPTCPNCQGPMWNERAGKYWGNGLTAAGKKKPTYKCRNKACGGALWIETQASGAIATAVPATPVAAPNTTNAAPLPVQNTLAQLYVECTDFVLANIVPRYVNKDIGPTPEAIASMVATLFIARTKAGT